MNEIEIVLQRIDELREDIKELFAKLEDKQSAIEKITREVQDIQTKTAHNRDIFDKEIQNLWLSINDLRHKPEKSRTALSQWVSVVGGITGWILLLLKTFGVLL